MSWILVAVYISAHFLLYVFVFRYLRYFRTERGIFLFHLVSVTLLVLAVTVAFARAPTHDGFGLVVGSAACHGIYSLTFLECWALSEGGYSLRILDEIVRRGAAPLSDIEQHFVELSAQKKRDRAISLVTLGLIFRNGEQYELTKLGRAIANVITLIAKFADFRGRS